MYKRQPLPQPPFFSDLFNEDQSVSGGDGTDLLGPRSVHCMTHCQVVSHSSVVFATRLATVVTLIFQLKWKFKSLPRRNVSIFSV